MWLILFCLVTVVGGTAWYTFTTVPVWDAETVLRIEEERSSLPILDILQTISQGSQVETEMEVLRSRTLAEQVRLSGASARAPAAQGGGPGGAAHGNQRGALGA